MSRNRYRKPKEGLALPKTNRPPKIGTFTPPAVYRVLREDDVEQLLQDEQEAVARIVGDAVTLWASGTSEASKAALRQRAGKLSLAGRVAARTLTKLRLDSRYPPNQSKRDTSSASEMLIPSKIERPRQDGIDVTAYLQEGTMKFNERTDLMAEANAYIEERRAEKNNSAEREKEREVKQHARSILGNSQLVQKTFSETVSPNVTVGQRNPVAAIVPSVLKPSATAETPAPEAEISLVDQHTQEINQSERAPAIQGRSTVKGWVYVISNKAMPGLVKVGYSMKDPELRARELDHTGAPHPYAVDYEVLVDEPYLIEQRVHRELSAKLEGREWFRCTAEEAIAAITFVTEGKRHVETFKRANREEANHMAEERRREEDLRRKEATRVAEERKHAEELERAIADQVAETTKRISEEYERETARQFPGIEFSPYWLGWGFVFLIAFYIVFDPIKHDLGTWIAATIAGAIAAAVHTSNATEKRKKSPAYLALIQKKDMAIQEAEHSIRRTRPGTSPQ